MGKKKYDVTTTLTLTIVTTVFAASPEDAKMQAAQRGIAGLCHACGGDADVEWACTDGLNGDLGEDFDAEELVG